MKKYIKAVLVFLIWIIWFKIAIDYIDNAWSWISWLFLLFSIELWGLFLWPFMITYWIVNAIFIVFKIDVKINEFQKKYRKQLKLIKNLIFSIILILLTTLELYYWKDISKLWYITLIAWIVLIIYSIIKYKKK